MDFTGKNVIVTGGSSGIGKSAAKIFANTGANVTIIARREDVLKSAIAEIRATSLRSDQKINPVVVDVSDQAQVEAFAQAYKKEFGAPDILINNAGIAHPGYFEEIPYEIFDQTMKINYYGVLHMCRSFVPMMKAKGGNIVNVSSVAGIIGVFGYTAYGASKFAIIGFSQALRSEMKRYNISVSVLCPPDTDTPQLEAENKIKPKETKAIAGNAGIMSPDNVADAMVKGMLKKKFLILPSLDAKSVWYASRLVPWLVELVMDTTIKKAQRQ
jgi:3-dehydrosphinganine reductase